MDVPMSHAKISKKDAAQTSGTSITPRGLRIEAAASYSGLSPFYLEQCVRDGTLSAIGGPGSGICAAYIILRDTLDVYLDELGRAAEKRAEERRKAKVVQWTATPHANTENEKHAASLVVVRRFVFTESKNTTARNAMAREFVSMESKNLFVRFVVVPRFASTGKDSMLVENVRVVRFAPTTGIAAYADSAAAEKFASTIGNEAHVRSVVPNEFSRCIAIWPRREDSPFSWRWRTS
jgi:hypothetical protein